MKAPAAAVLEDHRPDASFIRALGPRLAPQRRQHTGLGKGRFSHARVAEQYRQAVGLRCEHAQHLNRLALAPEEIATVLLLHCGEAAIRRRITPELAWS